MKLILYAVRQYKRFLPKSISSEIFLNKHLFGAGPSDKRLVGIVDKPADWHGHAEGGH